MIDGANLFAYVGNNPVRHSDPTGMWHADMHFLAVYWTGRMLGAGAHRIALRAALASQSLDDDPTTAAPPMKIKSATTFRGPTFFFFLSSSPGGDPLATEMSPTGKYLSTRMLMLAGKQTLTRWESLLIRAKAWLEQVFSTQTICSSGWGFIRLEISWLTPACRDGLPSGHQNGPNEIHTCSFMWEHSAVPYLLQPDYRGAPARHHRSIR